MPEAGQPDFGKQPRGDLRRQRDEALAEVERLTDLLDRYALRIDAQSRELAELRPEIERLRAELAEWEVENGMNRTFVRGEIGRLRAALAEMLESFVEPEDDNDILRRARAALG